MNWVFTSITMVMVPVSMIYTLNPADLYKALLKYPDPFTLINEADSLFWQLKQAYSADMKKSAIS